MLEDGAVGADHRLNAGYPVNGPGQKNTQALGEHQQVKVNKDEDKFTLWVLYTGPCSQDLKKQTGMLLTVAKRRRKRSQRLSFRGNNKSLPPIKEVIWGDRTPPVFPDMSSF